jgi:hypothetical protein
MFHGRLVRLALVPSRVVKGMRAGGRMADRVTIRNLKVVQVDGGNLLVIHLRRARLAATSSERRLRRRGPVLQVDSLRCDKGKEMTLRATGEVMKLNIQNSEGKTVDTIDINDDAFGVAKTDLIWASVVQRTRRGRGTHAMKNRALVSGGQEAPTEGTTPQWGRAGRPSGARAERCRSAIR